MGSLTIPTSGDVYVDANAVIYSVETQPTYWPILQPLWQAAQRGQVRLVSSELLVVETLVGPIKSSDTRLIAAYEGVFVSPEMRILPITGAVLREAARLRAATPSLRTPDAIHAATALLHGCAYSLPTI